MQKIRIPVWSFRRTSVANIVIIYESCCPRFLYVDYVEVGTRIGFILINKRDKELRCGKPLKSTNHWLSHMDIATTKCYSLGFL